MYHSGLVDVFSSGCYETQKEAEIRAKAVIQETKNDIQRQMDRGW